MSNVLRINKEITTTKAEWLSDVKFRDNNPLVWSAILLGPPGSPYEGGRFEVRIKFPENYPHAAPDVDFITKIYHPNVLPETGTFCPRLISADWAARNDALLVLTKLRNLLLSPDASSAADPGLGALYTSNVAGFNRTAREWTREFAQ